MKVAREGSGHRLMVVVALALVVSGFALVAPAAVASSPINVEYGQPTDYYEWVCCTGR